MNREELEEYIEAYGRELYSFCCFLTQNRYQADDLYQDTFLKLYENREKSLLYNPKGYLMSLAVNLYRNQKRKLAIRQRIVGMDVKEAALDKIASGERSTEEQVVQKEEIKEIRRVVKELPDKYRIPILLFYMEELPFADISAILKLPEGTVKSRIHRAKKIIKQKMEAVFYEI